MLTQEEINNFADRVYHAKMEDIPTILEDLVKFTKSKMYSEEEVLKIFDTLIESPCVEIKYASKEEFKHNFKCLIKK